MGHPDAYSQFGCHIPFFLTYINNNYTIFPRSFLFHIKRHLTAMNDVQELLCHCDVYSQFGSHICSYYLHQMQLPQLSYKPQCHIKCVLSLCMCILWNNVKIADPVKV